MDRNIALDILKLLMAFMVVGIHAEIFKDINLALPYFTAYGLFRIAVPVFLVISGFYFYQTLANAKTLLWFKRALLLYFFWMLIYSPFWFHPTELSLKEIIKVFAHLLVGYYHLWYVAGMIGAALILVFVRNLNSISLIFIVTITFLTGVIIQYAGNYHLFGNATLDKIANIIFVHRNALFMSFPFFCIGFLIHKHNIHTKIQHKTAIILTLAGILLLSGEVYLNYVAPGREGGFDNFFFLLLLCPALFILFMQINIVSNTKNIALYATAIYFVHPLFQITLKDLFTSNETTFTIVIILLSAVMSYCLIIINKRAKFIL